MTKAVLDASALIALMRNEPGAALVLDVLPGACISAVNLGETLSKFVEYGKGHDETARQVERLRLPVIPFDAAQAEILASLWRPSRKSGLSLGDRACLALGLKLDCPVMTADRQWSECDLGVEVIQIR